MQSLLSRPAVDHLAQPSQGDLLLPSVVIEKTSLFTSTKGQRVSKLADSLTENFIKAGSKNTH